MTFEQFLVWAAKNRAMLDFSGKGNDVFIHLIKPSSGKVASDLQRKLDPSKLLSEQLSDMIIEVSKE